MLWRVQSIVRGFPDLAHASKPKAATNEPGSGGIDGGIFWHWPSEQLRGLIRPAAFSSPYLRNEQHADDPDLVDRCYREIGSCRHRGGATAMIESAMVSSANGLPAPLNSRSAAKNRAIARQRTGVKSQGVQSGVRARQWALGGHPP